MESWVLQHSAQWLQIIIQRISATVSQDLFPEWLPWHMEATYLSTGENPNVQAANRVDAIISRLKESPVALKETGSKT